MKEASRFLTALAQAISTMSLYRPGHPARERAVDAAHTCLLELQAVTPRARFTFLGEEIVMDGRPLQDLKSWDWGGTVRLRRLPAAGAVGPGGAR